MGSVHPIVKQAANLPRAIREMAGQQAVEWGAMVAQLQTLQPDDPTAEDVFRTAAAVLQSITVNYGPIHGWTLTQHHVIYRAANRVFGSNQRVVSKPNWTES